MQRRGGEERSTHKGQGENIFEVTFTLSFIIRRNLLWEEPEEKHYSRGNRMC